MPDLRNPRHGASRKKSEIGSLFCRFYLVKRSFWRSKTAIFFACGELSHCKYPLWCYCTISPLIIRLPITFWISEGPETHIITKLESNPNLIEGGLLATSTKSRGGGLLGRGGSVVCLSPDVNNHSVLLSGCLGADQAISLNLLLWKQAKRWKSADHPCTNLLIGWIGNAEKALVSRRRSIVGNYLAALESRNIEVTQ